MGAAQVELPARLPLEFYFLKKLTLLPCNQAGFEREFFCFFRLTFRDKEL
jgi:hypothetical protein